MNPYKDQAKNLRNVIWAVDNGMMLEDYDMETLEFAANTLQVLSEDWENTQIDATMQQEVNMADESYRADLMGFNDYGDW